MIMKLFFVTIACIFNVVIATIRFKSVYNTNACQGEDHIIDFDYDTDEEVTLVKWLKTYNGSQILIAQHGNTFVTFGSFKGRAEIANSGQAAIKLKRVNLKDDGDYTCIVQAGTSSNTTTMHLTVSKPHSIQHLKFEDMVRKDESVEVLCDLPEVSRGIPSVEVYLKDEIGVKQSQNRITFNDKNYRCCISGVAVRCINSSRLYEVCSEKKSFQKSDGFIEDLSCKQEISCIFVATGFCLSLCTITLICWTVVICLVKSRHWTAFKNTRKIPTPVKSAFFIWLAAQIASVLVAVLFCVHKSGCYETEESLWFGLGSFFGSVILAVEMSRAYYLADGWNKHKKDDGDKTYGRHSSKDSGTETLIEEQEKDGHEAEVLRNDCM